MPGPRGFKFAFGSAAPLKPSVNGLSLTASGDVLFRCPFDPVTVAQLRRIRPRGCWQARLQGWVFPFEALLRLVDCFGERFPIDPSLREWWQAIDKPLPPLPPHRQLVSAADLQAPLADGRQLLAHQRAGVRWLLARRGALLADEMGLGKTLTALAAARALLRLTDCRLLVVAPVGLHDHWRREALALELAPQLFSWARLPAEPPPGGLVLVVDEAQTLAPELLEQVRLLTNLETETQKLLQIILIGQPELRDMLARNDLRQLAQRITGRYHLDPLSRDEAAAYIKHRLRVAGATTDLFNNSALRELYRVSGGVPRLLNIIADRALLGAYSEDRHVVNAAMVRRAAGEVSGQRLVPVWLPWGLGAASLVLLAGVVSLVLHTTGSP